MKRLPTTYLPDLVQDKLSFTHRAEVAYITLIWVSKYRMKELVDVLRLAIVRRHQWTLKSRLVTHRHDGRLRRHIGVG